MSTSSSDYGDKISPSDDDPRSQEEKAFQTLTGVYLAFSQLFVLWVMLHYCTIILIPVMVTGVPFTGVPDYDPSLFRFLLFGCGYPILLNSVMGGAWAMKLIFRRDILAVLLSTIALVVSVYARSQFFAGVFSP